ncbi:7933_t:CDS:2, partial [Ambispora gerdemannii]
GMHLNQHGLYTNVMRDAKDVKYNKGTLIAQRTEQEIFDALGVPYREPDDVTLSEKENIIMEELLTESRPSISSTKETKTTICNGDQHRVKFLEQTWFPTQSKYMT